MKGYIKLLSLFIAIQAFTNSVYSSSTDKAATKLVFQTVEKSLLKLAQSTREVKDTLQYPTYGYRNQDLNSFRWQLRTSGDWTSGFYPGCLWLAYELSGEERFKNWAKNWTSGIEAQKHNIKTHDLGFRFLCTFGNGIRLAPNDHEQSRYKEILLTAASTADSRYSTVIGQYPSDWDEKTKAIENSIGGLVDVMMNLELLLWASENGGDPAMKERCITHSKNVFRDLVRPDGGTYHIVRYDKTTGAILNKGQLQGDVDESTWSRGQAWMVYGYTLVYRYTRDQQFLKNAMKLADYFLAHLPDDKVANWDFQSTLNHRDVSASAIVCSALLELHQYISDRKLSQHYFTQAQSILTSLCSPPYFNEEKESNCLLNYSTQYYYKTPNTDVPSIFADYYFLESIIRYKKITGSL